MAQISVVSNTISSVQGRTAFPSLNEMIMSVASGAQPLTLRQIAKLGYFDIDTVVAALRDKTNSGALTSIRVGILDYYASPLTALTTNNPAFTSVAAEIIKYGLWKTKLIFDRLSEKLSSSALW